MVAYSKGMSVGSPAPAFSLPGVDGETYSLDSFKPAKLLVVIFTCNHCPYAQALEGRFIELQHDYAQRSVQLVAISSNDATAYPADSFDAMKRLAREHAWNFPYLYDHTQTVARAYDAACTPDIFVFDASHRLVYRGQLDDSRPKTDKPLTGKDLRNALDNILAGQPVAIEQRPSIGCNIKWKQGSEPVYFNPAGSA